MGYDDTLSPILQMTPIGLLNSVKEKIIGADIEVDGWPSFTTMIAKLHYPALVV